MKKERELIFNKYGGRCSYCGVELVKGWHVDHFEPVQRKQKIVKATFKDQVYTQTKLVPDGTKRPERDCLENKNPACASCNIAKSDRSLEDFRKFITDFVRSLNNYSNQYKFAKKYGLVVETNQPVKFYFETL